ncbi:hypothetical protein [Ruegeria sp. Ofav3-42]|uniref:hypothetical protein n=1 Tax=Ruegeria sp. Ofav3-42 TaxID=2917759 RepID=UPI001EF5A222|nr:hypothetical protein [Ruegeria sp. Ofav3-42]MCG7522129.1 hypothetical protein [Ruegeria sp. Ofav3-42]
MSTQVTFAVHPGFVHTGSTELRVFQLIRLLEKQLGEQYSFSVSNLPKNKLSRQIIWALSQPKGSVVVFSKWSLLRLSDRTLRILRARGVKTCLDYVDMDLREARRFHPDIHIAASLTAARHLKEQTRHAELRADKSEVFLIHHNLDDRFPVTQARNLDKVKCAYFGAIENTVQTEKIREKVTFIKADLSENIVDVFHRLSDFNAHYCIREQSQTSEIIAKPFTKGFVASHLAAPVLIDANVDDALELLGEDYPFVTKDISEESILRGLEQLASDFGSAKWIEAQRRVVGLKDYYTPEAVANQFHEMVQGTLQ